MNQMGGRKETLLDVVHRVHCTWTKEAPGAMDGSLRADNTQAGSIGLRKSGQIALKVSQMICILVD